MIITMHVNPNYRNITSLFGQQVTLVQLMYLLMESLSCKKGVILVELMYLMALVAQIMKKVRYFKFFDNNTTLVSATVHACSNLSAFG